MLKSTGFTLALLGVLTAATVAIPVPAKAGDTGPCDHCTMEPIVVKGERPKKKKTQTFTQQQAAPAAIHFALMPAPMKIQ